MKRILLVVLTILLVTRIYSCPPPTSHGILEVGTSYEYLVNEKVWTVDNIAIDGKLGYEEPYRYVSICAVGYYAFGSKNWSVGGEVDINPLGLYYGYDIPITFNVIAGSGYKSFADKNWYGRIGLELSGGLGSKLVPYIRCNCDFNGGVNSIGLNMCAGMRVWIGESW